MPTFPQRGARERMPDDIGQPEHAGGDQQAEDAVNWRALIDAATSQRPRPVQAQTFLRRHKTASQAVELACADGNKYVVKGLRNDEQQGRMVFNDQVAGRLGALLRAPVPEVNLVEVTVELIAANPNRNGQMGHLVPGTAHGSLRIDGVTERIDNFDYADENRARYASLAIFFGWLVAGDRQFIFRKTQPCLVYSHDHGHFFPGGPNWTPANLRQVQAVQAEAALVTQLKLRPDELAEACAPLRDVRPEQIAEVVALPPDEWGISLNERVALAEFLYERRANLLRSMRLRTS
jgi:hypothetical protein